MRRILTKKAGLKPTEGTPSKINPSNSHPSNPIHKAATASSKQAESKNASKEAIPSKYEPEAPTQGKSTGQKIEPTASQHEINKTAVVVVAIGVAALLFIAWR